MASFIHDPFEFKTSSGLLAAVVEFAGHDAAAFVCGDAPQLIADFNCPKMNIGEAAKAYWNMKVAEHGEMTTDVASALLKYPIGSPIRNEFGEAIRTGKMGIELARGVLSSLSEQDWSHNQLAAAIALSDLASNVHGTSRIALIDQLYKKNCCWALLQSIEHLTHDELQIVADRSKNQNYSTRSERHMIREQLQRERSRRTF